MTPFSLQNTIYAEMSYSYMTFQTVQFINNLFIYN